LYFSIGALKGDIPDDVVVEVLSIAKTKLLLFFFSHYSIINKWRNFKLLYGFTATVYLLMFNA